ncbi:MAG: preprotein translocase subunit SecE [Aquificaceae bacterium]
MRKIINFLGSVRSEMQKVSWPARKLAMRATVSVIIFSLLMGAWLWIMDIIFTRVINLLLTIG